MPAVLVHACVRHLACCGRQPAPEHASNRTLWRPCLTPRLAAQVLKMLLQMWIREPDNKVRWVLGARCDVSDHSTCMLCTPRPQRRASCAMGTTDASRSHGLGSLPLHLAPALVLSRRRCLPHPPAPCKGRRSALPLCYAASSRFHRLPWPTACHGPPHVLLFSDLVQIGRAHV